MEDYPRNLTEFEARFSSEETCREYLFRLRWPDGFRCPGLRLWKVVAFAKSAAAVRCVWAPNLGDRGDHLSGHAQPFAGVVSCDVVGHHPKDRSQRFGTAKSVGPQQVRNGLDVAAQNAARDGAAGTGFAGRDSGSRRKLLGRTQRGPAGPKPEKQSIDRSGRSRGWEGHRPDSHEENRGCVEREPVAFRGGVHRAGQRGAYRRLASLLRVGKGRLRPSGHGCQPAQAVRVGIDALASTA